MLANATLELSQTAARAERRQRVGAQPQAAAAQFTFPPEEEERPVV